jgi:hypothetical protein
VATINYMRAVRCAYMVQLCDTIPDRQIEAQDWLIFFGPNSLLFALLYHFEQFEQPPQVIQKNLLEHLPFGDNKCPKGDISGSKLGVVTCYMGQISN